jgi:hypothetical protein
VATTVHAADLADTTTLATPPGFARPIRVTHSGRLQLSRARFPHFCLPTSMIDSKTAAGQARLEQARNAIACAAAVGSLGLTPIVNSCGAGRRNAARPHCVLGCFPRPFAITPEQITQAHKRFPARHDYGMVRCPVLRRHSRAAHWLPARSAYKIYPARAPGPRQLGRGHPKRPPSRPIRRAVADAGGYRDGRAGRCDAGQRGRCRSAMGRSAPRHGGADREGFRQSRRREGSDRTGRVSSPVHDPGRMRMWSCGPSPLDAGDRREPGDQAADQPHTG